MRHLVELLNLGRKPRVNCVFWLKSFKVLQTEKRDRKPEEIWSGRNHVPGKLREVKLEYECGQLLLYVWLCFSVNGLFDFFSSVAYWCRFPGLFTLTLLFLSPVIIFTSLFWIVMPECLLSEACFYSHCIHSFLEPLCGAFYALLQSSVLPLLQGSYGMSFYDSPTFISPPVKLRKYICILALSDPLKPGSCLPCNIYLRRILCPGLVVLHIISP